MKITIQKITLLEDAHDAIETTMFDGFKSTCDLKSLYLWEHSPSRTQLFKIKLFEIPSFVSTHFVRHSAVGQLHFVKSNRDDRRKTKGVVDRNSLVNHMMFLNAQHLIDMSKVRLCFQASKETREVMNEIRKGIDIIEPELAVNMVPFCVYQGGFCHQPKPCGNYKVKRYNPDEIWKSIRKDVKAEIFCYFCKHVFNADEKFSSIEFKEKGNIVLICSECADKIINASFR